MRPVYNRAGGWALVCWLSIGAGTWGMAQSAAKERTFPQSKAIVEKEVKALAGSSGHLPLLDGFAEPGAHSLDHYQRGYYQCAVQVMPNSSGGSLVKVTAKITAWYSDGAQSGYAVLPSNGRLEVDLLDRLQDALSSAGATSSTGGKPSQNSSSAQVATAKAGPSGEPVVAKSSISAPAPGGSALADAIAASRTPMKSAEGIPVAPSRMNGTTPRHDAELEKEAAGLEEILRNQAHPHNLAAVKNSGTPVMMNPNEGAKVLFLAEAEDEFEILDSNASWVHVRVSGLSRGWVLRASVELPEDEEADAPAAPVKKAAEVPNVAKDNPAVAPPFQVENEQIASFPGNWAPLRGKTVKIVSVQKTSPAGSEAESKLVFAKNVFEQEYAELSGASSTTAGVVLIFDSEDGGMLAATVPVLKLWKSGSLSDEAMWRRCYFDPPEMVGSAVTR